MTTSLARRSAGAIACLTLAALCSAPAATAAAAAPAAAVAPTATSSDPAGLDAAFTRLAGRLHLSPGQRARTRAAVATLQADGAVRRLSPVATRAVTDTDWRRVSGDVIDPASYRCSTTPLQVWLADQPVPSDALSVLDGLGAFDVPAYDALFFGRESKGDTFGVHGSATNPLGRAMKSLRRFWDVPTDIDLVPMHGSVLTDEARVARVYEVAYGLPRADALELARTVSTIVRDVPELRGGDHPLFTFNAFAYDPAGDPQAVALGVTKRIVMGDGVLAGLAGVGLGEDAAAQGVLAHEYGHQVQYAKNLFDSPVTGPEATRRTELMADAMGTYAVVHSRGLALNARRTLQVAQSFYNVGDCQFASDGHHGTPQQRLRSSEWAVQQVDDARSQGHKLASLEFARRFDAVLPQIVAPDAR